MSESTALTLVREDERPTGVIAQYVPVPSTLAEFSSYGELFFKSGMFSDVKSAAAAAVKIMAGAELGFPPFASMNGVHIIKGKTSLSAVLMGAAIKRSRKYTYRVRVLTVENCELDFYERSIDGKSWELRGPSTFNMEDARKAKLLGGENGMYEKYPRNMLSSRALSNGARLYCADVFGGPVYTPDELGAIQDADGNFIAPVDTFDPQTRAAAPLQQAQAAPQVEAQQEQETREEAADPALERRKQLRSEATDRALGMGFTGDLKLLLSAMLGVAPGAIKATHLQAAIDLPDSDWADGVLKVTGKAPLTLDKAKTTVRVGALEFGYIPELPIVPVAAVILGGIDPGEDASLWRRAANASEEQVKFAVTEVLKIHANREAVKAEAEAPHDPFAEE